MNTIMYTQYLGLVLNFINSFFVLNTSTIGPLYMITEPTPSPLILDILCPLLARQMFSVNIRKRMEIFLCSQLDYQSNRGRQQRSPSNHLYNQSSQRRNKNSNKINLLSSPKNAELPLAQSLLVQLRRRKQPGRMKHSIERLKALVEASVTTSGSQVGDENSSCSL